MAETIYKKLASALGNMGPGIITAALIFGPGSLTINTKLGASFGFALLWVIPLAVFFMMVYATMAIKIGLSLDMSLIQHIRIRYGKPFALLVGIGIFLITTSFQAGNTIGSGVAFSNLFNQSTSIWIIIFVFLAIALLFFRSFYQILEKLMIGLVLLMLTSFLITVIISKPSFGGIAKGLIPTLPSGSSFLTAALMASSFSVVGAFYQAYLVKEKSWGSSGTRTIISENMKGIATLGILSMLVMICAAAVMHRQGLSVNTAADLGLALQPLFGDWSTKVYMLGFFAASFSSLLGNATIGGAILADAIYGDYRLSETKVRRLIILVILCGAGVALYFGKLPLELIITAQAITAFIAPLIAIFMLMIANTVVLKNSRGLNFIGMLGFLLILVLIFINLKQLFF